MIGQRLAESRKRAGLAQIELAVALGDRYNQQMISNVERGRRNLRFGGAVNAAKELGVSLDYLAGLTDDPTPAADRDGAGGRAIAETRKGSDAEDDWLDVRHIAALAEVAPAAGSGAEVYSERVTGWVPFRRDWLAERVIDPEKSNIVPVKGPSMEPTLPDGCSILVDLKRTEPHEGRIYVMRTEDGLVVKRVGKDEAGRWQIVSDHPDWEAVPMLYGTEIIGEVRWSALTY